MCAQGVWCTMRSLPECGKWSHLVVIPDIVPVQSKDTAQWGHGQCGQGELARMT